MIAAVAATLILAAACIVAIGTPARAASYDCWPRGAAIAQSGGRVVGNGSASCGSASIPEAMQIKVKHYYPFLPDATAFFGSVKKPSSALSWTGSVALRQLDAGEVLRGRLDGPVGRSWFEDELESADPDLRRQRFVGPRTTRHAPPSRPAGRAVRRTARSPLNPEGFAVDQYRGVLRDRQNGAYVELPSQT